MNVFFQWEFITKPTNYAILVLFNACFTEIVVWHKTNWDIDSNTEKILFAMKKMFGIYYNTSWF